VIGGTRAAWTHSSLEWVTELRPSTCMANPYPIALRERAVRAQETSTETCREVADRFDLHFNTLVRLY
jgi:hypothetical protein